MVVELQIKKQTNQTQPKLKWKDFYGLDLIIESNQLFEL
jgi:hypothetical protein